MDLYYTYKKNFIFDSNALVLLFCFLIYFILSYVFNHPIYLALFFINLFTITYMARSVKKITPFLKLVLFLGFFIFLFNIILNNEGQTVLAILPLNIPLFGHIYITIEVIIYSLIAISQLLLVIIAFSLINALINPDELMKTFLKMKMPYLMTFLVTSSLRFFPLLMKDLDQISDVQKSRGLEIDKGNIYSRIKNRIKIILPLLANSLERSIQVSEALESRGFGLKKKRTYYKHLTISKLDALIIFFLLFFFGLLICFRFIGYGYYQIFPKFTTISISSTDIFLILFIIISNIIFLLLLKLRSKMI
ncbi:MAG: energy-coupling factor transporter transmembrane component T [Candidatus Helarchaeota archaeon]